MNLKVNVGIELNKARVELTSDQKGSVEQFVEKMLLGQHNTSKTTTSPRKSFTQPLGSRVWKKEEEEEFLRLFEEIRPTVKTQERAFKLIGQKLGRTDHSCSIRLHKIRKNKGLVSANGISDRARNGYSPSINNFHPGQIHPVNN